MATKDGFRKYVEAAAVLGQVTRARLEEIARELVGSGELQRGQAQQWVDELLERSRKAGDDLLAVVRTEVSKQLAALKVEPEQLAKQVADILRQSAEAGRRASQSAAGGATAAAGRAGAAAKHAAARASGRRGATKRGTQKAAPAAKKAASKAGTKKAAKKVAKKTVKKATKKTAAKRPGAGSSS